MAERVSIVGSREWPQPEKISSYVQGLPKSTVVVTGAWWRNVNGLWCMVPTRGADAMAAVAAMEAGHTVVLVAGSEQAHGRYAGLRRNPVTVAIGDRLVAFHDGDSPGTQNSIDLAREAGKPVEIILPE